MDFAVNVDTLPNPFNMDLPQLATQLARSYQVAAEPVPAALPSYETESYPVPVEKGVVAGAFAAQL